MRLRREIFAHLLEEIIRSQVRAPSVPSFAVANLEVPDVRPEGWDHGRRGVKDQGTCCCKVRLIGSHNRLAASTDGRGTLFAELSSYH